MLWLIPQHLAIVPRVVLVEDLVPRHFKGLKLKVSFHYYLSVLISTTQVSRRGHHSSSGGHCKPGSCHGSIIGAC
jgi:hypothetical protein